MFNLWRINKKVRIDEDNKITGSLNSDNIKQILGDSNDIIKKNLYINNEKKFKVVAFGIDGMVDTNIVDAYIFRPLVIEDVVAEANNEKDLYKLISQGITYHFDQKERDSLAACLSAFGNEHRAGRFGHPL